MKNIAIILAGGVGNRLNAGMPKQFIKIGEKTILEYTLSAFQKNQNIDEIVIVINPMCVDETKAIVHKGAFSKVAKILKGGRERYSSSLAAIEVYGEDNCNLIFHDAVRPMVSQRIINDVVFALQENDAVGVGVSTTDTIWEINNVDNSIKDIPDRALIYRAQTPQAFRADVITNAYKIALRDPNFIATDDCGVVNKYCPQKKIIIVDGDNSNIKITYKNDIKLMEYFLGIDSLK